MVEIRDHGPGVPEDALPRIFDPFYRVETDRNRISGGIGLGLSIARRAVDSQGNDSGGQRAPGSANRPGVSGSVGSMPIVRIANSLTLSGTAPYSLTVAALIGASLSGIFFHGVGGPRAFGFCVRALGMARATQP